MICYYYWNNKISDYEEDTVFEHLETLDDLFSSFPGFFCGVCASAYFLKNPGD